MLKNMYLALEVDSALSEDSQVYLKEYPNDWNRHATLPGKDSILSHRDFKLVPGMKAKIAAIEVKPILPFTSDLIIRVGCGCEEGPLFRYEVIANRDRLSGALTKVDTQELDVRSQALGKQEARRWAAGVMNAQLSHAIEIKPFDSEL
jgi:hypothetical protein